MKLYYEHRVFSQNSEDGIIQVLTEAVLNSNQKFLEIGWGSGDGNMTLNLLSKGWSGVGVDKQNIDARQYPGLIFVNDLVTPNNLDKILDKVPKDVDFFSLDIDSFDFEIARWMLEHGWRPKTVCVEINDRFGPVVQASFPWVDSSVIKGKLYRKTGMFGCSIEKYRRLWADYGYRYLTFDSTATNAFFYDPGVVGDLSHLPTLQDRDFPRQDDTDMQEIINQHAYWRQHVDLIYDQYMPR